MKNRKINNTKEIPRQNIRPGLRKISVNIKSDSNITRTFVVKIISKQAF